ncbi:MAG: VOC family protein [Rhodospirillales bacterium]
MTMPNAKLRHIAITVKDLDESAAFYEKTFDLTRNYQSKVAVSLSDGTVNITLLKFPTDDAAGDERGKDYVGVHHFGFVVDDVDQAGRAIEANGGRFHRAPTPEMQTETKYRDPNGIVLDVTHPGHMWAGVKV